MLFASTGVRAYASGHFMGDSRGEQVSSTYDDMKGNFKGNSDVFVRDDNHSHSRIVLSSSNKTIRRDNQKDMFYEFQLDVLDEYDYSEVMFESSDGLVLSKDKRKTIKYDGKSVQFDVDFSLDSNCTKDDIVLDYDNAHFEKIKVNLDAFYEDSVVQTEEEQISVYPTEHGTFMSRYGDVFAYDGYLTYLHDNSLITDEELKKAYKSITELEYVTEQEEFESNNISEEVMNFTTEQSLMTTAASTSGTIVSPSVRISRTITALSSGSKLMVYGYVYWTDITGTTIPARDIEVQIMDEDVQYDDIKATVYTNKYGYYSATIENQNDSVEKGCDIYIRVNTCNDDFEIGSGVVSTIFADGYYITTSVTSDVTTSKSRLTYYSIGLDRTRAISIHQALVAGYYYYEKMNNDDVNTIMVKYPGGTDGSWSDSFLDLLNIEYNDYCDWDVIIHELGHQVATQINVDTSFEEDHRGLENLSERYGKSNGIKGAWDEGWASYFSMAAQNYYSEQVADISDIAYVADNTYTDLKFDSSTSCYIEEIFYDYATVIGCGDGNEVAVAYVLLYLVENGYLTHQELWDVAKRSSCDNFSDFMQTLYECVDESEYSGIGKLLERQNIVDTPIKTTSLFSKTTPGTFKWNCANIKDYGTENGEDDKDDIYSYPNRFRIVFWDDEYNAVFETGLITSEATNKSVTLSATQWKALVNRIGSGDFYWCLATYQTSSPSTGPYYSSFIKGTMQ